MSVQGIHIEVSDEKPPATRVLDRSLYLILSEIKPFFGVDSQTPVEAVRLILPAHYLAEGLYRIM